MPMPVRYKPVTYKGSRTLAIASVGTVILVAWSLYFRIDQVVHAPGQIVPIDGTQVIQASDNGVLDALPVKEGQFVYKGQLLAVLDKGHAQSSYQEAEAQVAALNATITRLSAEIAGHAPKFSADLVKQYPELVQNQLALYQARQAALHETLSGLDANLAMARTEYDANAALAANGDISRVELLRARRAMNDVQLQMTVQKSKYVQDAATELATARINLQSIQNVAIDRKDVVSRTNITANVDGIVKNIKISSVGAVLHAGDEIMDLFPTSSRLVVDVKMKPSDMFQVSTGLPAKVRLDNYDYSTYGDIPATVSYVSNDAITEESKLSGASLVYYKVRLTLAPPGTGRRRLQLSPGMTATVYIRTGNRSVFQYIFKPVTRTLNTALTEK